MGRSDSKLIAAAQASWVFGGMGSLNDLGFDGDDQKGGFKSEVQHTGFNG